MKRLAVFASGNGSNYEAISAACACGRLDAEVAVLVCDHTDAYAIRRAAKFGTPVFAFCPKDYASKADYEKEIVSLLDSKGVDLVCLAGYMRIIGDVLLKAYASKIINIHPSLLPAFRGAHAVEQAVAYGVKVYGITIHWVDESLDGGRIIAQRAFGYDGNDPEEVHRLGQAIEHELYVETINKLINE